MTAFPVRGWATVHPTRVEFPHLTPAHDHGACRIGMMRHGIGIWIDFCGSTSATSGAVEVIFAGGEQVLFAGGEQVVFA